MFKVLYFDGIRFVCFVRGKAMGLIDSIFKDIVGDDDDTGMFGDKLDEKAESEINRVNAEKEAEEKRRREEQNKIKEAVFEKSYVCPVCDEDFKNVTVRTGKCRRVGTYLDLKPIYEPFHMEYYDIVLCDKCGYAALSYRFETVRQIHINDLKEATKDFKNIGNKIAFTEEDAIFRYKQALKCSIAKKEKLSERAFLELNIAWIYRDLKDKEHEKEFILASYNDFVAAISKNDFEVERLSNAAVFFIISNLAYRLGNLKSAAVLLRYARNEKTTNVDLKNKMDIFMDILRKGSS